MRNLIPPFSLHWLIDPAERTRFGKRLVTAAIGLALLIMAIAYASTWVVWLICVGALTIATYDTAQRMLLVVVCAGLPWIAIWELYRLRLLPIVLAIAWGGDTASYLTGGSIGKHSFAKAISPRKTWEGAIGGLAFGAVIALGLQRLLLCPSHSPIVIAYVAIAAGIFGQLGDLLKSFFKRSVQVKDRGVLLPGHGGIIDRIDSLIFAAPVVWMVLG